MAEETTPNAPLPDEQSVLDPGTPGASLALPVEAPAKEYFLTRRDQKIAVIQYVDDIEVTETISYFLNFCQDMGWSLEVH